MIVAVLSKRFIHTRNLSGIIVLPSLKYFYITGITFPKVWFDIATKKYDLAFFDIFSNIHYLPTYFLPMSFFLSRFKQTLVNFHEIARSLYLNKIFSQNIFKFLPQTIFQLTYLNLFVTFLFSKLKYLRIGIGMHW